MKKITGLATIILLAAGPAFGAGNPLFNWSGWSVGGNAGYGWGANTGYAISSTDPTATGLAFYLDAVGLPVHDLNPKGFIGGGQIGYDWQNSSSVLGIIADFQGADIKTGGSASVSPFPFNPATEALSEKLDFLGTLRARIGFAADNWLFYASGGLAYGHVSSTLNFASPLSFGVGFYTAGEKSEMLVGWALGGGVNYALTDKWIIGLDYVYYDLGRTSAASANVSPGVIIPGLTISASQLVAGNVLRTTVGYKF